MNKTNIKSINPNLQEIDKVMKDFKKQNIKALRNIFKNEIKETFLINILNHMILNYPDIYKYYRNPLNHEDMMQGDTDSIDYDICCHIVGIHKTNMMFLSEEEKGKKQKDPTYQRRLCEQIYKHIVLRQYGSSFFRKKNLINTNRFLYFTMGYDMFVTTTFILSIIKDLYSIENELYDFYTSLMAEALSILTLVENGLLPEAFPQCRNLIELYYKYCIIRRHPEAFNEYQCFCQYEIDYAQNSKFNEEFIEKYNTNCKGKKVEILDYLHFGWIDAIFDMNYLEKGKHYSITGLYNYLSWLDKNNDKKLKTLKEAHKWCHMFSHGSTIAPAYSIPTYFKLMKVLYYILTPLLFNICKDTNIKPICNGIDLLKKIDEDSKEFMEKIRIMNNKEKHNFDAI